MKKTIIILLWSFTVFSQSGKVYYKVKSDFRKAKDKKIKEEVALMSFVLTYNDSVSHFKKMRNVPLNRFTANIYTVLLGSYYDWFQLRKAKETFYVRTIKGKIYHVNSAYKTNTWQLTDSTKVIDGYTCYKAVRKRFNARANVYQKITAWYTPEIPVPYGPVGNGGLPGLILQLYKHKRGIYTVDKILLNPKKVKVKKPKKGETVSVKEIIAISTKARKVTKD